MNISSVHSRFYLALTLLDVRPVRAHTKSAPASILSLKGFKFLQSFTAYKETIIYCMNWIFLLVNYITHTVQVT